MYVQKYLYVCTIVGVQNYKKYVVEVGKKITYRNTCREYSVDWGRKCMWREHWGGVTITLSDNLTEFLIEMTDGLQDGK